MQHVKRKVGLHRTNLLERIFLSVEHRCLHTGAQQARMYGAPTLQGDFALSRITAKKNCDMSQAGEQTGFIELS